MPARSGIRANTVEYASRRILVPYASVAIQIMRASTAKKVSYSFTMALSRINQRQIPTLVFLYLSFATVIDYKRRVGNLAIIQKFLSYTETYVFYGAVLTFQQEI